MRIMIDIDDTLTDTTHVWQDLIERATGSRPDLGQVTGSGWSRRLGLTQADFDVLIDADYHSEAAIAAGMALPGAAAVITGWRTDGHHVTIASDRRAVRRAATRAWLARESIGFDALVLRRHLDKVALAQRAGIDLVIDDRSANLRRFAARAPDIHLATILTRENRDSLAELPDVIAAPDWASLGALLGSLLAGRRERAR